MESVAQQSMNGEQVPSNQSSWIEEVLSRIGEAERLLIRSLAVPRGYEDWRTALRHHVLEYLTETVGEPVNEVCPYCKGSGLRIERIKRGPRHGMLSHLCGGCLGRGYLVHREFQPMCQYCGSTNQRKLFLIPGTENEGGIRCCDGVTCLMAAGMAGEEGEPNVIADALLRDADRHVWEIELKLKSKGLFS